MNADDDTTTEHLIEIDVGGDAASLLRSWRDLVRGFPHSIGAEARRIQAWSLVAWYERVVERDDFESDPPTAGLDALIDELALVSVLHDMHADLSRVRWAIRVAEELVKWRHLLRTDGPGSRLTGPATDRLELAMEEGRRHVEDVS